MMHHVLVAPDFFQLESRGPATILRLTSPDGINRLTRACIRALTAAIEELQQQSTPLIITGNRGFFSVGADLKEIAALTASEAYEFSAFGQTLMNLIAAYPAAVVA